ncbi:MAG: glutamine--tRNA ligase, partial [Phycisphaerae bacterium]|nr:glutamine--tRNA ligase [Phycisphaerae bacterium]
RKVKGTLHWVAADAALPAEVRLYDRLFTEENPGGGGRDFRDAINPDSLEVISDARVEPALGDARAGVAYQFERLGYFCLDAVDASPEHLVFNRTVTLRDSWAKHAKGGAK